MSVGMRPVGSLSLRHAFDMPHTCQQSGPNLNTVIVTTITVSALATMACRQGKPCDSAALEDFADAPDMTISCFVRL